MIYLQDEGYIYKYIKVVTLLVDYQEFTEYTNLEECITFLCEYITSNGPFAGLLGFSQVMHPTNLVMKL
jgi:hypothetical protein